MVVMLLYSPGSGCWKSPGWLLSCGKGPGMGGGASQGAVPGEGVAREGWGQRRSEAEEGAGRPTSILGLDGDDPLALWTKPLGGLGLHLELVGHVLTEAWHCQPALGVVTIHQERGGWL